MNDPHDRPGQAERNDLYQLVGEIARDGLAAVLRGRDVDLGREVLGPEEKEQQARGLHPWEGRRWAGP